MNNCIYRERWCATMDCNDCPRHPKQNATTDPLEKYIDTSEPGAEQEIRKYLANGWFVYYEGITLVILRRDKND